jgi:hypothetical protein
MMTCRDLCDCLDELIAGELSAELLERTGQHLYRCQPCALLVESYRITIRLVRRLPPRPMPPSCLARLQAALGQAAGPGSEQPRGEA